MAVIRASSKSYRLRQFSFHLLLLLLLFQTLASARPHSIIFGGTRFLINGKNLQQIVGQLCF